MALDKNAKQPPPTHPTPKKPKKVKHEPVVAPPLTKPSSVPAHESRQHVDNFVNSVLDPDKTQHGYPGNSYATLTSPQVISISGQTYSDDGDVSLYVSANPEIPAAFSARESRHFGASEAPVTMVHQPIEIISVGRIAFVYPLSIGTEFVLFAAPVTSTNVPPFPGYHATISLNSCQFRASYEYGTWGVLSVLTRNTPGAVTAQQIDIEPSTDQVLFNLPNGTTAFGFVFESHTTTVGRIILSTNGGGSHGITFGNHSSFCRLYPIPDRGGMDIQRARLIGAKTWIKYLGSSLENAGRIAAAQFPPGTYPTMFRGTNTYEQIISANIRGVHDGSFKEGCVSRYIQPNMQDYELNSAPSRFGESGIIVHTWSSDPLHPQPYRITIHLCIEYTSKLTFVKREQPPWASPNELSAAVEILNRMQVITENPSHDYVVKLWNKLKRSAYSVATSPKTWHTIAEVGGAALALL